MATFENGEPAAELDIEDVGGGPKEVTPSIPEKQEDARRWLAKALVVIFAAEVLVALISLFIQCASTADKIKDIMNLIMGPTVALVGSATGFYFGAKADGHTNKK